MLSGLGWALLYNGSMESDHVDTRMLAGTVQETRELVEEIENYPDIDLFANYK
jgi:hypothetical protein